MRYKMVQDEYYCLNDYQYSFGNDFYAAFASVLQLWWEATDIDDFTGYVNEKPFPA